MPQMPPPPPHTCTRLHAFACAYASVPVTTHALFCGGCRCGSEEMHRLQVCAGGGGDHTGPASPQLHLHFGSRPASRGCVCPGAVHRHHPQRQGRPVGVPGTTVVMQRCKLATLYHWRAHMWVLCPVRSPYGRLECNKQTHVIRRSQLPL